MSTPGSFAEWFEDQNSPVLAKLLTMLLEPYFKTEVENWLDQFEPESMHWKTYAAYAPLNFDEEKLGFQLGGYDSPYLSLEEVLTTAGKVTEPLCPLYVKNSGAVVDVVRFQGDGSYYRYGGCWSANLIRTESGDMALQFEHTDQCTTVVPATHEEWLRSEGRYTPESLRDAKASLIEHFKYLLTVRTESKWSGDENFGDDDDDSDALHWLARQSRMPRSKSVSAEVGLRMRKDLKTRRAQADRDELWASVHKAVADMGVDVGHYVLAGTLAEPNVLVIKLVPKR